MSDQQVSDRIKMILGQGNREFEIDLSQLFLEKLDLGLFTSHGNLIELILCFSNF